MGQSFKNRPRPERRKQVVSDVLNGLLLDFLQRKFYAGNFEAFQKDRARLIQWVTGWPAVWLNEKGVTLPDTRYQEIFENAFMEGLRFGNTGNITYLPAWLAKVIQSHYEHNEDAIYDEAKRHRSVIQETMTQIRLLTGKAPPPDPVAELAAATRLLKAPKRSFKPPVKDQLTLL